MPDTTPLNLLHALTEHQGYETAVYCTYGVDLAFFEEAVLRPLRNNRCRRHIIFADSQRYADTIGQWRDCAQFVGQQYLLVPVQLPPFQAFHPKLTLLLGPQRGRRLLGSGNLTFTGFGHNHELYTCLDWTPDQPKTLSLFQAVWQFIESIQGQWSHNRLVNEALRKAEYQAPWLHQPMADAPADLAFWHSLHTPLLDQLEQAVGAEPARRLTVVTPFLDRQALAIAELNRRFQPGEIRLVLQPQQAVGDVAALTALQAQGVPLSLYRFGGDGRYLHAKLLLLETETGVYALSGSANCTRPALLATPETRGNIETALLRRVVPGDYFNYLLPPDLLPDDPIAPSEITLRPPERIETDEGGETAVLPVHLRDLRLESGLFHLQLHWNRPLPSTISELYLRLDTEPPGFISLTLADGEPETAVSLPPEWGSLLAQPVTGMLVGLEINGHLMTTLSNALWVSNAAALKQAAAAGWYGGGAAADVLAAMAAESEAEWRDLYAEIQRLVLLDVAQISQRPVLTAGHVRQAVKSALPPVERETPITLATEESALELAEDEQVATAVSRESELQAFFDHIRQRLPGQPPSPAPATHPGGVSHPLTKRKWTPERHTKTRFVNLVKKYVASLQNPLYRQQTAVVDSLIHYVVFQRIVWLLHTHQGLEMADCLGYWRAMNAGFFGAGSAASPVTSPLLRQQCRYGWRDEWWETAVPLYALANLWQMEQALAQEPEHIPATEWAAERQHILAFFRVVVDWDALRQTLESLTPLVEIASLYTRPVEELALGLLSLLDSGLAETAEILHKWAGTAVFNPHEITDRQQARLLYQANVDYRRALFRLHGQMGEDAARRQIASELVFWARRAGDNEEAHRWQAQLVALYRVEGDEWGTAVALYRQAQQHLRDQQYTLAEQVTQEALALANQLGDEPMTQRCEQLLSSVVFMAT